MNRKNPIISFLLITLIIYQTTWLSNGLAQMPQFGHLDQPKLFLQALRLKVLADAAIDQEPAWQNQQWLREDLEKIRAERQEENDYPVLNWLVKEKPIEGHQIYVRMVARASMEKAADALVAWASLGEVNNLNDLPIVRELSQKYPGLAHKFDQAQLNFAVGASLNEAAQLTMITGLYIGCLEAEIATLQQKLLALATTQPDQLDPTTLVDTAEELRDRIVAFTATIEQMVTAHPLHVTLAQKESTEPRAPTIANKLWQDYQSGASQEVLTNHMMTLLAQQKPVALRHIASYLTLLNRHEQNTILPLIAERLQVLNYLSKTNPGEQKRFEGYDRRMSEEFHLSFGELQTLSADQLLWSIGVATLATDAATLVANLLVRSAQWFLKSTLPTTTLVTSRLQLLSKALSRAFLFFFSIDWVAKKGANIAFANASETMAMPAIYATAVTPRYGEQLAQQNINGIVLGAAWELILVGTFYGRYHQGTIFSRWIGAGISDWAGSVRLPVLRRIGQTLQQIRAASLTRSRLVGGAIATAGFMPILTYIEMGVREYHGLIGAWKMITTDEGFRQDIGSALIFSFFVGFFGEQGTYFQYAAKLAGVRMASNILWQRSNNRPSGESFDWYDDINWERVAMEGAYMATVVAFTYRRIYQPVRDGWLTNSYQRLFGATAVDGKPRPGWLLTDFLWNMTWCATITTVPYVKITKNFYNDHGSPVRGIPIDIHNIVSESLRATIAEIGESEDSYATIAADVETLANEMEQKLKTLP